MPHFTTDSLRPHERFDYWCEERARNLSGVTISVPAEERMRFYGHFSATAIGDATLAELRASSYIISRTDADIERVPGESLCISRQIRGPGWMDTGRDRIHLVAEGALTVGHSDSRYEATPKCADGFHYRTLRIPLKRRSELAVSAGNLTLEPLAGSNRLTMLISASMAALDDDASGFADAGLAVQHLAQLALLARGRVAPGDPASRAALRSGYLHAALHVIRQALHRPDLSVSMVARMLSISSRQLHLLFEPTGTSYARTVMNLRLAKVRRLLVSMPDRPVLDIAYACGFDSLATFYRAFRLTYDMTPREAREITDNSSR